MRIFVGLDVTERNDFDGREFDFAIEAKNDWVHLRVIRDTFPAQQDGAGGPGAVINLNMIFGEPVSVKVKGKAAE